MTPNAHSRNDRRTLDDLSNELESALMAWKIRDGQEPSRRELDRDFPAVKATDYSDTGNTYWVRTGDVEFLTDSAAHQRAVITLHNLTRNMSTDDPFFNTIRHNAKEM
jgi:hypothetical protein